MSEPAPGTETVPSDPYAPPPSPTPQDPAAPPVATGPGATPVVGGAPPTGGGTPPAGDPASPADPPLRHSTSIQANILAAFLQDHVTHRLVALPADPVAARAWLADVVPLISMTDEVETSNEQFSKAPVPDPSACWVSLALTVDGLKVLAMDPTGVEADLRRCGFTSLLTGPVGQATALGDTGASAPSTWDFGGPGQPVIHAVVTVAADREGDRTAKLAELDGINQARGASVISDQRGGVLPGDLRGHEHFGFKDGISQPGVVDFHAASPAGERAGHPGTALVAAGEFVFGQPTTAGTPRPAPTWLVDGSIFVFRRLRQDVAAWRQQTSTVPGMTPDEAGSLFMGRRPDGSPLAAVQADENPQDPTRNTFDYSDDLSGAVTACPAHIRKANPRSRVTPSRRIMRRGIPYGDPFDQDQTGSRGLLFVCYGTSLEEQFEFIQQNWINNPGFGPDSAQPGPDPVIGPAGTVQLTGPTGPVTVSVTPTVTTAGAVYGLTLSLPTLRLLAEGAPLLPTS